MFRICSDILSWKKEETAFFGRGFQMTFPNGFTVSVQFGDGNYCDNSRMRTADGTPRDPDAKYGATCENAEVAVIDPRGELLDLNNKIAWWGSHDTVCGYVEPEQVVELMAWAMGQPAMVDAKVTKKVALLTEG